MNSIARVVYTESTLDGTARMRVKFLQTLNLLTCPLIVCCRRTSSEGKNQLKNRRKRKKSNGTSKKRIGTSEIITFIMFSRTIQYFFPRTLRKKKSLRKL